MTKEQLLKLYDLELITLVTGEDVLLDEIKDMEIEDALNHLKNLEIFNHVIDNESILNLIGVDATPATVEEIVAPVADNPEDDANPEGDTDPEELPVVDEGDE